MKGRFWRKALAAALALLIVSGSVPIKPISDIFGSMSITASAAETAVSLQQDGSEYYVNMASSGTTALTLSDASITTFKVYDDGGKNSHYAYTGGSTLKITVPIGYVIGISGTAKSEDTTWDYWKIYKGHVYSDGTLFDGKDKSNPTSINVQTTGNKTAIYFHKGKSSYSDDTRNLELTVTLIPDPTYAKDIGRANVSGMESVYSYTGSELSASYSVYSYIDNELLTKGTDYTETITKDGVETEFKEEGYYTLTITGKDPYFGSQSFTLRIKNDSPELRQDGSDYYINFPGDGTKKTVYLSAGQTIKVYDSEGKNGNLVPSDGCLMLYAPEGYALEVTGKTDAQYDSNYEYLTWLKAYDGNDETETTLITTIDQNNDNISFASAADGMLMRFYVHNGQSAEEKYGLDLTVRVVEATPHNITVGTADNGSIASDKATANTNESVTLTVNPADGYLLKRIIVTDTDNGTTLSTIGEDHWYSGGNTVTYKMPNKNIKFTPEFANVLSADDGLTLNIDPIRITEYVIPEGVQSFNIKGSANNLSTVTAILKAPEGVRLLATIDNCEICYSYSYISVYDGTGSSSTLIKKLTQSDASISPQTSTAEYMTFEFYGFANTRLNGKIEMVYSIDFDLAGGSVATENPATYTYDTNAFTLTNPTREGYEFAGWTGTGLDTANTSVTIAKGSYGNRTYTATWKKLLTNSDIMVEAIAEQTYTGKAITPDVTVKDGESTLTLGTDYTIEYSDNTNAGTAKATITGKGNYSGTVEKTFAINKATPTVTAPTANTLTYNGGEQELLTAGSTNYGKVLYSLDGTNYSEKVPKGTNAGKYTVYYKVDTDNYYYAPQKVEVTIAESYTIKWKNGDETLETDYYVPGGATPEYNGETPTKADDTMYSYSFAGWSPNVSAVSENAEYTATFTNTPKTYNVTYKVDGVIYGDVDTVAYGTALTARDVPARDGYIFSGWSEIPETMPASDIEITGTFCVDENYGKLNVADYKSGDTWTAPTQEGKVFAGWFADSEYKTPYMETTGYAYAKFIDESCITVKWQKRLDNPDSNKTDIRLVSTLDCGNYDSLHFVLTFTDNEFVIKDGQITRLYDSLDGFVNGKNVSYTPDIFCEDSKYFAAYTVTGMPNSLYDTSLTAKVYIITLDGTRVEGTPLTFKVADDQSNN